MPSSELRSLLLSGKLKEAEQFVLNAGQEYMASNGLDLIAIVSKALKENVRKEDVVNCCETLLLHIGKTGVPKEVLVGILEQISITADETLFQIFLKPLELILLKLPSQRGKTLKWTLDTLQGYVAKLQLPESCNYEGEERLLLDLDPNVQKITHVIRNYLNFLKPFVEEVSLLAPLRKTTFAERISYQRFILCHHLLQLLDYPLTYLDLSHEDNKAESSSRVCAVKLMTYLRKLKGNSLELYEFANDYVKYSDSDMEDADISILAISTLAYLVMKERLGNIPHVLAPVCLVETHLKFCTVLLSNKEELVQFKGLHLLESILSYGELSSLPKELLEHPYVSGLQQSLITIMIYSGMNEYRQHALQLFKTFIEKLESDAKCLVLLNLLSSERHAGVRGLLVTLYKDNFHQATALPVENPFLGHNLRLFLQFAMKLPEKVETDLLEESDCIFSTLNFFRYLVIRDPKEANATGVWDLLEEVKTNYLETLRLGLNLSRAHYKRKAVEELDDEKKNSRGPETVLQVGNQTLPNLPTNHHMQVLQSALLTFDLLESVIVRLEENL